MDEPTVDQPTADQPTADQPTSDGPTSNGPTSDGPTSYGPTPHGPTPHGPTVWAEPAAGEPRVWAEPAHGAAGPAGPLTVPELFVLMHRDVTDVPLLQSGLLELVARDALAVRAVQLRRRQWAPTHLVLTDGPRRGDAVPAPLLPLLAAYGAAPRIVGEDGTEGVRMPEFLRRLRTGFGFGFDDGYRDGVVTPSLVARGLLEPPSGRLRLPGLRATSAGDARRSAAWERARADRETTVPRGMDRDMWLTAAVALAGAELRIPPGLLLPAILQEIRPPATEFGM